MVVFGTQVLTEQTVISFAIFGKCLSIAERVVVPIRKRRTISVCQEIAATLMREKSTSASLAAPNDLPVLATAIADLSRARFYPCQ